MNRLSPATTEQSAVGQPGAVREIVIVDAAYERYGEFVRAAQAGQLSVHFCVDGRSALRMARRFRADTWIVAADLPDMSGFDLIPMLSPHVMHSNVDPLLSGARISLGRSGKVARTGLFIAADQYRLEEEQRALVAGVTGYLVGQVTPAVIQGTDTDQSITADPVEAEVA